MMRLYARSAAAATAALCVSAAARPRPSAAAACAAAAAARPLCQRTRVWCKDIRKGDRGEARRLTFAERAERRAGKTKEEKENKQVLQQEAEMLVQEDFPAELEEIFAVLAERANTAAMKVLNMAKCLELLDVDVNPGARQQPGAQQNKILLTKVAQVVKTSPTTIEITPTSASFATPILQRISRFDSTLQVSKEQNTVKVTMQPVTTAQRDKAAEEVRHLISVLRQKCKASRHNATRVLQDSGIEDGLQQELGEQMDDTLKVFVEEKAEELELLALEVMSMGIDESDKSLK